MRPANVDQPSFDDLTVAQEHDRPALMHLLLRSAWQWPDDEFDSRHFARRELTILSVDAQRESAGNHVDQLATRALAILQRKGCRLLCSERQRCSQTEQSDSNGRACF